MPKNRSLTNVSDDIPNPFERRQFAFRVLPEEKDPMSRARKYSLIMPTLTARLQQLLTTRIWEYLMFILSIWSFVPLLFGSKMPSMRIFFELTHEITQAALSIEVFCKLYIDCRWFFYDLWNCYDLLCVILNSPFIYNLFLSDHLGIPEMNSIPRIVRTLHAIRLIRIHSLLRFVIETIFIALSSIYHTLLLELIIITVFALLSIAFEGDTPFAAEDRNEPYENYTEALYSYYMCITLEGVNEVAEQILELDEPQFTTVIGLIFYIFAALVTYSVGQLLSAVVAATLDKAINQITQDKSSISNNPHHTKLIGLQRPSVHEGPMSKSRCLNTDEIANFSQLKPSDLALLIILFQVFDQNLSEFANLLHDIRQIGESIAKSNEKKILFHSLTNEHVFLQHQRLKMMINTLNQILHDLTDEEEFDLALNELDKSPSNPHDLQLIFQSIEEKIMKIENKLRTNALNNEQNQHHLHLIDRLKEKFYKNIPKRKTQSPL